MYSFGGILAIQGLFELGFNQVLQQYVSHERPLIRIFKGTIRGGQREALLRLRVCFRIAVIWYGLLGFIVLIVVGIYGDRFFAIHNEGEANWRIGWWILVTSSVFSVLTQPFMLVINGLDFVSFVNKWRTLSIIIQTVVLWAALGSGLSIMAQGLSAWVGAVCLIIPFWLAFYPLYRTLSSKVEFVRFRPLFSQIFRLQTRTAATWMTGYLVYQAFSPILLLTTDAIRVGQFGMTQAVLASAASFPLAWVQTKLPRIGAALGVHDFALSKKLFKEGMVRVMVLSVPVLVGAYAILFGMQARFFTGQRILSVPEASLLIAGFAAQNVVLATGGFVRAHKADPFVLMAWVQAGVTVSLLWLLSVKFSLMGAAIAFVSSWLIAAIWGCTIFLRFWNDPVTHLPPKH